MDTQKKKLTEFGWYAIAISHQPHHNGKMEIVQSRKLSCFSDLHLSCSDQRNAVVVVIVIIVGLCPNISLSSCSGQRVVIQVELAIKFPVISDCLVNATQAFQTIQHFNLSFDSFHMCKRTVNECEF